MHPKGENQQSIDDSEDEFLEPAKYEGEDVDQDNQDPEGEDATDE